MRRFLLFGTELGVPIYVTQSEIRNKTYHRRKRVLLLDFSRSLINKRLTFFSIIVLAFVVGYFLSNSFSCILCSIFSVPVPSLAPLLFNEEHL